MTTRSDAPAHHGRPPFDVVCIGLATRDTIVALPAWPEPDGRVVVDGWMTAGGGGAATAAVAAARLGARVAFAGVVGDDAEGRTVTDELASAGVDVGGVVIRPGATARSVILVDRSRSTRSILHAPGLTATLDRDARPQAPPAAWTHVDHAGWQMATGIARDRLSVDAGNPIPGLELAGVGLYAPTHAALGARYPGRSVAAGIRAGIAEGARRVVVTLGSDGAIGAEASGAWRVAGYPVEVASTLGAGDVFHGVLVAALATGRPLGDAIARANVAAALSCRALDGRTAIPTAAELAAALHGGPRPERIALEDTDA